MARTADTRRDHVRPSGTRASDVTDRGWALLAPLLPAPRSGGRPRTTCLRREVNAIFHLLEAGSQWRMREAGSGNYRAPPASGAASSMSGRSSTWRVLGPHRSTRRKAPSGRADEAALTADIALATQHGRYGYRPITAMLHAAGWAVNVRRPSREL
jgi:putative transposase